MTEHLATAISLAFGIGAGAFMISQAQVFSWLRKAVNSRTPDYGDAGFWSWLHKLVNCPFCVATWLSLAATAIYRPLLVHELWPLDYLTTALAVSSLAMLPVLIIRKALGK